MLAGTSKSKRYFVVLAFRACQRFSTGVRGSRVVSRTFSREFSCFVQITKHDFRTEMFTTANRVYRCSFVHNVIQKKMLKFLCIWYKILMSLHEDGPANWCASLGSIPIKRLVHSLYNERYFI